MKFILTESQAKSIMDESILSSLFKSVGKNVVKSLPQSFKYLTSIENLIKPEIKSLIKLDKPNLKFTESIQQKFYNLFRNDVKSMQQDLKNISNSDIKLTDKGVQNLLSLTRNSNKLDTFISTRVGSELNIKDYVETIYTMKNQSDNLVNELLIISPKSSGIETAKKIQSKVNQIIKNNEELFRNAKPSSSPKPSSVKKSTKIKDTSAKKMSEPKKPAKDVIPKGNFPTMEITRDKYGLPATKNGKFLDNLFQKVFYEGFDKRHNMFTKEVISKMTPETKSYLTQLKDVVEQQGLLEGPKIVFKDTYGYLPKTTDEVVEMISGNLWGGGGRRGGIQTEIKTIPIPPSNVIENLLNVTMSSTQKQQVLDYYKKLFNT